MLEVNSVTKRYDDKLAVDRASLTARAGRILGLLGPNGAGKTSILRMVNNITKPDAGEIRLNGRIVSLATQRAVGYMPEDRGLYKNVRVLEQLTYVAQLKGLSRQEARVQSRAILEELEADGWEGKRPRELSRGMQQKVQFALALVHKPDLIILDEPFSGLDPINSALMERTIRARLEQGATVIFASHRMEQVEDLCDEICLIANGKIVLAGDLAEVKRSFGRDSVSLEFDGDGAFLDSLAAAGKIELLQKSPGKAELRLTGELSTDALLDAVRTGSAALYRYAATYPSLRQIFLRVVDTAATSPAAHGAGEASKRAQGDSQ